MKHYTPNGQGYFQSTPLQLCLMTAQIANGGFEIKPRIIFDKKNNNLREYIKYKNENQMILCQRIY